MNGIAKALAIGLVALTGLVRQSAIGAGERSPDGKSLDQLAKSGSDLSKLHQMDFTLRFPTQNAAQRAELELIGLAFETKIERGKTANEWVIHASKVMYPVETDLAGLRDKLNAIAAENHGTYDGWRARVFERKVGE